MVETKKKTKGLGAGIINSSDKASRGADKQVVGSTKNEDGMNKWLSGIQDQVSDISNQSELDSDLEVRAVPISLIMIDKSNPRDLSVEPEDLLENLETIKLPAEAYGDSDDWVEPYKARIKSVFGGGDKAQDIIELAFFAAAIKSPRNIMSPICVWREETSFFIFAGERRYLIHYFFHSSHAVVRIWHEKPSQLDMKILQWQENHEREDLSIYENLVNIRQILDEWQKINENKKMTVRNFAQLVSMGRSQAGQWLKVSQCRHSGFDEALKGGLIGGIEPAYELACLNAEKLEHYVERICSGEKITKDVIHAETSSLDKNTKQAIQNNKNQNKPEKNNRVTPIKFNTKANPKPVAFMIRAVAEKLEAEELLESLNEFDLEKPQDVTKALSLVFEYLEKNEVGG